MRKLSAYNVFMKKKITELRKKYPNWKPKTVFKRSSKLWKKVRQQSIGGNVLAGAGIGGGIGLLAKNNVGGALAGAGIGGGLGYLLSKK